MSCNNCLLLLHPSTCQVDLLGKSLVVWVDSKGQWNCLEDRCAHKLGRLSEGRVEGDNIQVRNGLQSLLSTGVGLFEAKHRAGQMHTWLMMVPGLLAPWAWSKALTCTHLQCGYHGWTFEGSTGKCVRIPQLDTDPAAHTTACNSAKSCVASYPTRVSCGLLWIWPESGPQAAATAAATPNYEPPTEGRTTWFVRDNPIRSA
jgi:pheophorbide a oxygenase